VFKPSVLRYCPSSRFCHFDSETISTNKRKLADALQKELSYEGENYEPPPEIKSFLANSPFKVEEDKAGQRDLILKAQIGPETVRLLVDVSESMAEVNEDEDSPLEIAFTVLVSKIVDGKDHGSLDFEVVCRDGSIEIEQVAFIPDSQVALALNSETMHTRSFHYAGPLMAELSEEVQSHFRDYLSAHGIDEEMGTFVEAVTNDKEQREYCNWLKKVSKFMA